MKRSSATEQIYTATQLWWLPLILTSCLAGALWRNRFAEVSVVLVEGVAIIAAAWLSSHNYTRTMQRISRWTTASDDPETKRIDEQAILTERSFRLFNIVAFGAAIVTIYRPTAHLFAVECVYGLFCVNNMLQGFTVIRQYEPAVLQRATSAARRDRAIELRKWLSEENGPAIIAYPVILLLFYILEHLPEVALGFRGEAVRDAVLRGIAAGAAGFHLTVSTFKYRNWQRVSADLYSLSEDGHKQQATQLLEDTGDAEWVGRLRVAFVASALFLGLNAAVNYVLPLVMRP